MLSGSLQNTAHSPDSLAQLGGGDCLRREVYSLPISTTTSYQSIERQVLGRLGSDLYVRDNDKPQRKGKFDRRSKACQFRDEPIAEQECPVVHTWSVLIIRCLGAVKRAR